MEILKTEWKWFGNAGHFICAQWCRFHLCTQVGPWLVSTVGEYVPLPGAAAIMAKSRGITLEHKPGSEQFDAEYIAKIGCEEIGYGRKYETMVFKAGNPCTREGCNCGLPSPQDYSEIDGDGYNDAGAATQGHLALCEKWAKRESAESDD